MTNFSLKMALVFGAMAVLSGCIGGGSYSARKAPNPHYKVGNPYKIDGRWYYPEEDPDYDKRGVASWYGQQFHGKPTANGEIFDMRRVSAAHPTLPLPSFVEVTNLKNGRRLVVRVNDRGPFAKNRIIDMSRAAAKKLGFERDGLAPVRVRYMARAPLPGESRAPRYAERRSSKPVMSLHTLTPVGELPPDDVSAEPSPAQISSEAATATSSPDGALADPGAPSLDETVVIVPPTDGMIGVFAEADTQTAPKLPEPLDGESADLTYSIFVAILDDINDLPALRDRLAGLDALAIEQEDAASQTAPARYRINLGSFPSEKAAEEQLEAVRKAGYDHAVIVANSP